MVLLDTCIVIEYINGNKVIIDEINKIGKEEFLLNDIIIMELFVGARDKRDLRFIKNKIDGFYTIEVTNEVVSLAKNLVKEYYLSNNCNINDSLLASSSLIYDIELFTYNLKHFNFIPDLKLYNLK